MVNRSPCENIAGAHWRSLCPSFASTAAKTMRPASPQPRNMEALPPWEVLSQFASHDAMNG
jgi:hypothetical protein